MNWWQSLLIALVPAIIIAFISWLISHTQIKNAKKELKEKYENENKLYISKTRFNLEFGIYKEISESLVALAMNTITLFPIDDDKSIAGVDYFEKTVVLLNTATEVNNKYAIFIINEWYEKFTYITNLCRLKVEAYKDKIINQFHISNEKEKECCERTQQIKDAFDELVFELRTHINTLGVKENN